MIIPGDLRYTRSHEWVGVRGGVATVGITSFVESESDEITYIELPEVGDEIGAGDELASMEAESGVSVEVASPISGEVVAVNDDLSSAPGPLQSDPYGEGWIARIRIVDSAELEPLLNAEAYEEWLDETSADED